MVNRERQEIFDYATSLGIFHGTLCNAKEQIDELIKSYGENAKVEWYNPPYERDGYWGVFVKRPETDSEMAKRIAREESDEKIREAHDAAEFKRLQEKFAK